MAHYFKALGDISRTHKNARIKFLVLDVIDLRANKWVMRKKEIKALKLDELERSLQEKEQEKVREANKLARESRDWKGDSNSGYGYGRRPQYAAPENFNSMVPRARRPTQPRETSTKGLTSPSVQSFRPSSTFNVSHAKGGDKKSSSAEESEHTNGTHKSKQPSSSPPSTQAQSTPKLPQPDQADQGPVEYTLVEAEERLERKMGVMLEEWEQCGFTEETALSFLEEIEAQDHVSFLCSGVKFVCSANKYEKQRWQFVLLVHILQRKAATTPDQVLTALISAVNTMADIELWVDVPGLWHNLSQVLIELLLKQVHFLSHYPQNHGWGALNGPSSVAYEIRPWRALWHRFWQLGIQMGCFAGCAEAF